MRMAAFLFIWGAVLVAALYLAWDIYRAWDREMRDRAELKRRFGGGE